MKEKEEKKEECVHLTIRGEAYQGLKAIFLHKIKSDPKTSMTKCAEKSISTYANYLRKKGEIQE
jgi:hypothetical protein